MRLRPFAFVMILSCSGCAGFINSNPGEEVFSKKDYEIWLTGKREIPKDMVGTWKVVEVAGSSGDLTLLYKFQAEGIFIIADEQYFRTKEGKARWEGAFRTDEKNIICHYQRKDGDNSWLSSQGGKGNVKNFPFRFNDADTLMLGNQTSQNLVIKYKRVDTKAIEE
jgi:hypothetical protein